MKVNYYNYFKGKHGQRGYPYWFFYLLPTVTLSRTNSKEKYTIHLGFLWFIISIKK